MSLALQLPRKGRLLAVAGALNVVIIFTILIFFLPSQAGLFGWRGLSPLSFASRPSSASSHDAIAHEFLTESLDQVHLSHLSSPLTDHKSSNADNEVAFVVGEHHAVEANYPDDYEWIEPYSREPFVKVKHENGNCNSAIGRMPAGSPYDALVIARGLSDIYNDKRETVPMVNLTIIGFFTNYNPTSKQWERVGPEPYVLDLPVWRQYPRPCDNLVNGGQADPRFMWSDAGEPLAIIGTASRVPGVCKAVGMVDLRAVWPGLKDHLEELGYSESDIPITFDAFTEIGKASNKAKYEKNWAPFFSGPKPTSSSASSSSSLWWPSRLGASPSWLESLPWFSSSSSSSSHWQDLLGDSTWPYFSSQVVPRTVLQVDPSLDTSERSPDSYILSKEIDLSIRVTATASVDEDQDAESLPTSSFIMANASSDCLTSSLPSKWDHDHIHQATPFYRVTMCPRGTCEPTHKNTLLLGLVHYKKYGKQYRRMFVTMSTEPPFRILSVSPPLHFGSVESDKHVVFSVSLAFFPSSSAASSDPDASESHPFASSTDPPSGYLNHGWLDDIIVVGAGLKDEKFDSIHLRVDTALRGHTVCPTS